MTHVAHNTGNMEWYTPDHILQFARNMLDGPFDLDPASCEQANRVVGASRFYTKEPRTYQRDVEFYRDYDSSSRHWLTDQYGNPIGGPYKTPKGDY